MGDFKAIVPDILGENLNYIWKCCFAQTTAVVPPQTTRIAAIPQFVLFWLQKITNLKCVIKGCGALIYFPLAPVCFKLNCGGKMDYTVVQLPSQPFIPSAHFIETCFSRSLAV